MRNLAIVMALALAIWVPSGLRGSASTLAGDAKPDTANSQRREYQKQIDRELRELDREINDLKARAPQNKDQLREQFHREMAELQQKREVARQKLNKLRASTQRAWHDMEPEVDKAMKDLDAAYQRAAADFKDSK